MYVIEALRSVVPGIGVRKPDPQPIPAKLRTPSRCWRRVLPKNSVSMFGHQTCGYSVGDRETDVPSWLTVRG